MSHGKLLTVRQVAEHLQLSPSKVKQLAYSGELASLKIGRSRRISEDAVLDFIERRTAGDAA